MIKKLLFSALFLTVSTANALPGAEYFPAGEENSVQYSTVASYFDQFEFNVEGDCSDLTKLWFRTAHSFGHATLGTDSSGRPIEASLTVQVFKDGNYWAEYAEHAIISRTDRQTVYEGLFEKQIEGTWAVKGDRIELSKLGFGIASTYKIDYKILNSIQFTLTEKINDPRAVQGNFQITRAWTNIGPFGASKNQYCDIE